MATVKLQRFQSFAYNKCAIARAVNVQVRAAEVDTCVNRPSRAALAISIAVATHVSRAPTSIALKAFGFLI
jgi:hypothetical protein